MAQNSEDFRCVATFVSPSEAALARGLLDSFEIDCYLENDHVLTMVWAWNFAYGGIRLMVPTARAEEAFEVLDVSEGASDVPPPKRAGSLGRWLFAACLFMFSPNAPEWLRLFRVSV